MILPVIYITLYLLTVVICFTRRVWTVKYKKILIVAHLTLFLLIIVNTFLINLKGAWLDRLLVVAFMLTASTTFAFYKRTLRVWQKLYFGLFVFYPAIAASTFLIDRIMFVVVASPLLVSLIVPETRFSDKNYEVREQVGAMAPMRLQLIKKGYFTERVLGTCSDEEVVYLDISSLSIKSQTQDTTKAIITSKDKRLQVTFTQ